MSFSYNEWDDVTVVIPTYNAEKTIQRALHSVEQQTIRAAQIIVVDGGSVDQTVNIVNQENNMEGWITPIKLLQLSDANANEARNLALSYVTSKYVAFLDADDEWHKTKLERSLPFLQDERTAFVAHDYVRQYKKNRKYYFESSKYFENSDEDEQPLVYFIYNYIRLSTVVMRTDVLRKMGGFDATQMLDCGYDLINTILTKRYYKFQVFKAGLVTHHSNKYGVSGHVLSFLKCHDFYIQRHAPHIAQKVPSFVLAIVRVFVLYRTALVRAFKCHQYVKFMLAILRLPYSLLMSLFGVLLPKRFVRGNYLPLQTNNRSV